jgi:penicillin amidase
MLLEPHLGHAAGGAPGSFQLAGWTAYRWPYSSVALENILERQPARWLPAQFQSFDDLLTAAMSAAISEAHGSERQFTQKRWRWGVRFPLTLQHPIFGAVPILNHWSGPGTVPQTGDSFTIKAAGPEFGPSERMTVDFADLDQSTLNIVTGESGNLFSPNYMDQWAAWYHGTTFAFPFSPSAVTGAAVHRLTLAP